MDNIQTFFPLKFSASMLETLHRCQTAFFRQYIQNLSVYTKNPDLTAGSHIAKACEIVRTAYFTNGFSPDEAIELGKEYILLAEDIGDSIKSNENVAYCLEKYFKKFKLDETLSACELVDGSHAIEYKFDFDLGIPHPDISDKNITFTGRLDYICEDVKLNHTLRYGLDEKSCKSVYRLKGTKIPDYEKEAAKYRTNSQILSYAWACQQLGIDLEEFLIRRIPITSEFEPSFELRIPITQFAIDMWFRTTYNKIIEFVEKYKMYKSLGGSPLFYFQPTFQELACMNYSKPCIWSEGCISKDGEYLLQEKYMQRIYDRDLRKEIPLEEYLESLKNG
jgi:hypothetical protein